MKFYEMINVLPDRNLDDKLNITLAREPIAGNQQVISEEGNLVPLCNTADYWDLMDLVTIPVTISNLMAIADYEVISFSADCKENYETGRMEMFYEIMVARKVTFERLVDIGTVSWV